MTSESTTRDELKVTEFDYNKISITAKLVAFFRKFSDIPFAKEVAEYVHAADAVAEIAKQLDESGARFTDSNSELTDDAKVYGPILETRYKSLVQLIHNSGTTQVLELASGFSLRGLAMSQNSADLVYVDTDLPGIREEKGKLVEVLSAQHSSGSTANYHIAIANALDLSQLKNAAEVFRKDRKLVIVNEGLLMYLSVDERSQLAKNVREILSMFSNGAWITPDFSTREVFENVPERIKNFRRAISGTTDRALYENAFENEEALEAFIRDHGFAAEHHYQVDLVPQITSLKRLGLHAQVVERLRPRLRIWDMKPSTCFQ
ncbi:MAG: class I SAM-dependent methyltransferase [Cyanobacteria bacterium SZAS-4]|nr:class I SAM-dependent methyltransferase [Cyanobacteria bacterium SZAS-4]